MNKGAHGVRSGGIARLLDRREWLRTVAGAFLTTAARPLFPVPSLSRGERGAPTRERTRAVSEAEALQKKAMVVVARHDAILEDGRTLAGLLNQGVMLLTGGNEPAQAWSSLFEPTDVVGIKVNCIAGRHLSTHPEVVAAVVEGLKMAGISEKRIIIWDRLNRDLRRGGFEINTSGNGVQCVGNDAVGYDPNLIESGSVGSFFSNLLTKYCTAVVNVPVLKDHDLAGVSLSMKNFYGAIHNPNKYHDSNCNPYVAELYSHPLIREKVRLTVCDAIVGQYHGGPSYVRAYARRYNGLLIATDPVALDRVGADIIEAMRRENGLPSLKEQGREPGYIATAAAMGLGIDAPQKIETVPV